MSITLSTRILLEILLNSLKEGRINLAVQYDRFINDSPIMLNVGDSFSITWTVRRETIIELLGDPNELWGHSTIDELRIIKGGDS